MVVCTESKRQKIEEVLANGAVGIDLGTTYSAVAAIGEGGRPEVLTNAEGSTITPSVVLFDQDGTTIVGDQAKAIGPTQPTRYFECVKRCMGNKEVKYELDGKTYSPEGISAIILAKLIKDASERLGKPVRSAVITVPAWFNDEARQATLRAGEAAGLHVLGILSEPTAAALAYGIGQGQKGKTILVYDLGGGTFDVSLIRIDANGNIEEFAREGDVYLGGKDWDQEIINKVTAAFQAEHGQEIPTDSIAYATLMLEAEKAKKFLTVSSKTKIFVTHEGKNTTLPITREEFDSWTTTLLARSEDTLNKVLTDAKLTADKIDVVLPVGGSTRMLQAMALLDRLFPGKADTRVEKDQVVAIGACLYMAKKVMELKEALGEGTTSGDGPGAGNLDPGLGGSLKKVTIGTVSSRTYGIAVLKPDKSGQYIDPFVKHNQKLPLTLEKNYRTVDDNQENVLIELFEGDSTEPEKCQRLADQTCPLPSNQPAGTPLRLKFEFTSEGMILITMLSPGQGVLKYTGAALSQEEKDNVSKAITSLAT